MSEPYSPKLCAQNMKKESSLAIAATTHATNSITLTIKYTNHPTNNPPFNQLASTPYVEKTLSTGNVRQVSGTQINMLMSSQAVPRIDVVPIITKGVSSVSFI